MSGAEFSLTGQCWCGATKIRMFAEPRFAIRCFCRDCQHVSGGGHLPQVAMDAARVEISGPVRDFTTQSASGNDLKLQFCGTCGSPISKSTTLAPEMVFLMAAVFDDAGVLPPMKDVYSDRAQSWDTAAPN